MVRQMAIGLLTLHILFVVLSGPLARIDSDGELAYALAMDLLAGAAIVIITCLSKASGRRITVACLLAFGVTGGLSYVHWKSVADRKHARDHLKTIPSEDSPSDVSSTADE